MEFKHPTGWGGVCYQLVTVPNHSRRGQVIWAEKPGTAAPTWQLASTFPNSQASCEFRKVSLLPQASSAVVRGQKTALFYPKVEAGITTHIIKALLRCHMNWDHKGLKTGH